MNAAALCFTSWPPTDSALSLGLFCAALLIGGIIGWVARAFVGGSGVIETTDNLGPVRAASAPRAAGAAFIASAKGNNLKQRTGLKGGW